MTTAALPTVEDLVAEYKEAGWDCLPDLIDQMFDDCLEPGMAIKEAASGVYTSAPCGYYYSPSEERHGIYLPEGATRQDLALCKAAASRVGPVVDEPLTIEEVSTGNWVKVAASETPIYDKYFKPAWEASKPYINAAPRKTLEYLNFLPGKYPGGIPNFPSPIASMVTTGLLGAGLGYGAGWLGEQFMPEDWEEGKLRRTMAILGGLYGLIPGAYWGGMNVLGGRGFNDPGLLQPAPKHPKTGLTAHVGKHSYDPLQQAIYDRYEFERASDPKIGEREQFLIPERQQQWRTELEDLAPDKRQGWIQQSWGDWNKNSSFKEANDSLPVKVGQRYKNAVDHYEHGVAGDWQALPPEAALLIKEAFADTFGMRGQRPRSAYDINVDALGNTLWDVGAQPGTAAMTMGALHAAQQMPGGRQESGWVTPMQMANLAAHMGAGYVSGALVGSALGILTGMPDSTQQTLKDTGMYLGVVKSVVPRLFGQ